PATPTIHDNLIRPDPPAIQVYPLSLHDALPISVCGRGGHRHAGGARPRRPGLARRGGPAPRRRSRATRPPLDLPRGEHDGRECEIEEHTSELQSPYDIVCRLLLEKKKKTSHILE